MLSLFSAMKKHKREDFVSLSKEDPNVSPVADQREIAPETRRSFDISSIFGGNESRFYITFDTTLTPYAHRIF